MVKKISENFWPVGVFMGYLLEKDGSTVLSNRRISMTSRDRADVSSGISLMSSSINFINYIDAG